MGLVIIDGEGAVLGFNVRHPIVSNGDFCCVVVGERCAVPRLLWEDLLTIVIVPFFVFVFIFLVSFLANKHVQYSTESYYIKE